MHTNQFRDESEGVDPVSRPTFLAPRGPVLEQPTFGQLVRTLREQRGLSQAALAEGGLSTGYLSRLESGARPPTWRVIEHIAARLDVPVTLFEAPAADVQDQPSGAGTTSQATVLSAAVSAADDALADELLTGLLHSEDQLDPALRWQALWLLARIRGNAGEREEEHQLLIELVELSHRIGSTPLIARAQIQLARCLRALGSPIQARDLALDAHRVSSDLPLADQAGALHALLAAEAEAGLLTDARAHADELVKLTDAAGGTLSAEALWAAATVCIRQGDHTIALERLELALERLQGPSDLLLWMRLRLAEASLCLQVTPPRAAQARRALDAVDPLLQVIGTDLHRQEIMTLRAHLAFEEGDQQRAWELCEELDRQESLLTFRDRIKQQALRGRLIILRGERDRGVALLRSLAREAEESHNVELASELWRSLAESLASLP